MRVVTVLLVIVVAWVSPVFAKAEKRSVIKEAPQKGTEDKKAEDKVISFSSPESVATDGQYFYVSNVGPKLAPTEKDGDGFISRVNPDGTVDTARFVDGLDAPKGLAIVDNILYTADIDRVMGFDLAKGQKVYEITLVGEATVFLNALEKKDKNTLFVSSTDTGKIFEVTLGDLRGYQTVITGLPGPNGLVWRERKKKLYVVCWGVDGKPNGTIGEIDTSADMRIFKRIGKYEGYLDGVVYTAGHLIFSDWVAFEKKGVLRKVNISSGEVTDIPMTKPIGGPADFIRDPKTGDLFVPAMIDGDLLRVPWPEEK